MHIGLFLKGMKVGMWSWDLVVIVNVTQLLQRVVATITGPNKTPLLLVSSLLYAGQTSDVKISFKVPELFLAFKDGA